MQRYAPPSFRKTRRTWPSHAVRPPPGDPGPSNDPPPFSPLTPALGPPHDLHRIFVRRLHLDRYLEHDWRRHMIALTLAACFAGSLLGHMIGLWIGAKVFR